MLARPLFRENHDANMSEADAEALLHDALKVGHFYYAFAAAADISVTCLHSLANATPAPHITFVCRAVMICSQQCLMQSRLPAASSTC